MKLSLRGRALALGGAALMFSAALTFPAIPAVAATVSHGLIVYSTIEYSDAHIYTVDPVTHHKTLVVRGSSPAWSPDGTKLAYISLNNKIVIRTGSSSTFTGVGATGAVTTAFAGLDWSPDGAHIAFTRGSDLWVMNTTAPYHPHLLITSAGSPSWSPDGTKILYTAISGNPLQLRIVSANGSGDVLVPCDGIEAFGRWSPDGTRIAFITAPSFVMTCKPDGSDVRTVTSTNDGSAPAWSPTGNQLAYETINGLFQLDVINVDGTGNHVIATGADNAERIDQPDWKA